MNEARSWVSAVKAVEPSGSKASGSSSTVPFEFAHVSFVDHRRLQTAKPDVYQRIHAPPAPVPGDFGFKWMQYSYEVLACDLGACDRQVRIVGPEGQQGGERPASAAQSGKSRRVELVDETQGPLAAPSGGGRRRWTDGGAKGSRSSPSMGRWERAIGA
eukprot:CAMPEP_0178373098 /NCGR_PEP_ID=MMETSP0689_2-20121128/1690_1 /TAXON_ID=160604 /ORGANISM="Amphidinium massartii, Strain CS-259" /LENGTH=158 /DNA_ID=CAMNT_0019993035 /DNA_START=44 /DNA_END=520 /DNA_ORIENTATION=+